MADHLPPSAAGSAPDGGGNRTAAHDGTRRVAPLDDSSGAGLTAGQRAGEEVLVRAELASLTELRAGLPGPSPAVLAQARGRLLDRAARVGGAGTPVGGAPALAAAQTPTSPVAPAPAPAGAPARTSGGPDTGRRRLRPRVTTRSLIAVAVAAVVVAAGLFVLDTVAVSGRAGATAEASSLLRQAASVSSTTPDPPVGPTQYRQITTRASNLSTRSEQDGRSISWLRESVTTLWVPGDPTKPWIMRQGGVDSIHWFDPAVEAWARQHGVADPTPSSQPYLTRAVGGEFNGPISDLQAWQAPTPGFLSRLPRDPDQLLARIYHDSRGEGRSKDGEALVFIADVLRCGFVPADLRAALFRAATGIPGVTVTDHAANLAGRTGVAVARDEGGDTRQEMIFDPATGEFIGEREVVLRSDYVPGVPAGTAISYTAVSSEVVDSAPTG